jgi:hypothetical protein
MKRLMMLAMIFAVLLLGVACDPEDDADAPALDDPSQTGQELVEMYISLVADKDVDGLEDFLSDAFIRQGTGGGFATKDDYLDDLPQISNFPINDVTAKQAGDALVVRWLFTVEQIVNGQALQTESAPRLTTFVWEDEEWKLLSHANFNPPAE